MLLKKYMEIHHLVRWNHKYV